MTDEHDQDERQTRERAEMFRFIVESATEYAIFTTDLDRRVSSWNVGAERLMLWSEADLVGQSADLIFTPEDRQDGVPEKEGRRALADGKAVNQRWHMRADGSRFWGDGLLLPLKGDDGEVRGFVKIFRDRTAELRAEEARKEADRRKDEFLAILAHELRNPLAAIGNAAQVSLNPVADEEAMQWSKEVISRQVKNLSIMIDDLLDISRINQGKINLKREPLHVGPIIARALESVSHLIEEKRHELKVAIANGPLHVRADPTRLEQVIANLVSNAAKYTDPEGSIAVSASAEQGDVVIRVKDSGIGLTGGMLTEVFELFSQVDKSLDRSGGGLGIGLAVVKKLVEMHGGTVEASSAGLGHGSEFTIRLRAFKGAVPSESVGVRAAGEGRSKRILVVDDSVDTAIGMSRLLRLEGHEVEIAHDGDAAIEVARSFLPDVLVLDIGLPGRSGYDIAATLRREEPFRDKAFIAATGYGRDQDRERSRDAGFDHHVAKPIDINWLLGVIAASR